MDWIEMSVTLVRQEAGFGFRIVGGTEEGSQVGAMVRSQDMHSFIACSSRSEGASESWPMKAFSFYKDTMRTRPAAFERSPGRGGEGSAF